MRKLLSRLIMVDIPGTKLTPEFSRDYDLHPWGGVILFAKNIESAEQLKALTAGLAGMTGSPGDNPPMLIAVDHEGGIVSRFSFAETVPLCGNMALGATGSEEYSYNAARICARDLRSLGINTNFAPCVDVNNNPRNPIIGARSFGEDPGMVARLGREYIRGLAEGGIVAAAKHFPGHGDTAMDSHSSLPMIPHSMKRLEDVEIVPYREAIGQDVAMIMTAHIVFPVLEPGIPATMSRRILRDYLRSELGYQGVIITDSMSMKAVTETFGYEEGTIRAFEAGADMALLCGGEKQQISTLNALEKAVESGRLNQSELNESAERISRLRSRLQRQVTEDRALEQDLKIMGEITLSSITLVKNERDLLPLAGGQKILLITPDCFPLSPLGEAKHPSTLAGHMRKRAPGLEVAEYSIRTGVVGRSLDDVDKFDTVVFAAYSTGRLPDAQKEIAGRVLKANRNLVVTSLNSAYALLDIPEVPAYINCYNYGDLSMEALARVLFGESKPLGKLPVSLPGYYPLGHCLSYK